MEAPGKTEIWSLCVTKIAKHRSDSGYLGASNRKNDFILTYALPRIKWRWEINLKIKNIVLFLNFIMHQNYDFFE